jgi:hypothetical protein
MRKDSKDNINTIRLIYLCAWHQPDKNNYCKVLKYNNNNNNNLFQSTYRQCSKKIQSRTWCTRYVLEQHEISSWNKCRVTAIKKVGLLSFSKFS